MAIVINIPVNGYTLRVDNDSKGLYTTLSSYARIKVNGNVDTVPLRLEEGDWLDVSTSRSKIIKLS